MFEYKYLKYKNKYFKKKINNISGGGNDICVVCLEPINTEENVKLSCTHKYHLTCIGGIIWTKYDTDSTISDIFKTFSCCICRNDEPVDATLFPVDINNLRTLITGNRNFVEVISPANERKLIEYISLDLKTTYKDFFIGKMKETPSFQQLLNIYIIRAIIKNELYQERTQLGDIDTTVIDTLNAINQIMQSNDRNVNGENIIRRNDTNPINRIVHDLNNNNNNNNNNNSVSIGGGDPSYSDLQLLCIYIKVYSKYIIYLFKNELVNVNVDEIIKTFEEQLIKGEFKVSTENIKFSRIIYNNLSNKS